MCFNLDFNYLSIQKNLVYALVLMLNTIETVSLIQEKQTTETFLYTYYFSIDVD